MENAGPQLRQWRLKQYSHCKCKGGKEHEFLKLKFLPVESRDEITVIVYVERAVEQKLGTALAVSATGSSQVSSMSSQVSSGSHLASVKTTAAFDSISYFTEDSKRQCDWVKAKLGKYNILQTFTYESIQGPPVLYLSFLFYAVTLREKHYSLMEGQCYWYASAASANLQNIFPTENIEDQENLRTKGTRMGVHIPISNEFKTEVREQYDEFKKVRNSVHGTLFSLTIDKEVQ